MASEQPAGAGSGDETWGEDEVWQARSGATDRRCSGEERLRQKGYCGREKRMIALRVAIGMGIIAGFIGMTVVKNEIVGVAVMAVVWIAVYRLMKRKGKKERDLGGS